MATRIFWKRHLRSHLIRYYGYDSKNSRGMRKKVVTEATSESSPVADASSGASDRCSRSWAMLIKRVYEVDPLSCPCCKSLCLHRRQAGWSSRAQPAAELTCVREKPHQNFGIPVIASRAVGNRGNRGNRDQVLCYLCCLLFIQALHLNRERLPFFVPFVVHWNCGTSIAATIR